MLLNLTIDNWMSYHDEATLSRVGTFERQHQKTLSKIPGFRSRKALPVASIYGGNASGKTGLFKSRKKFSVLGIPVKNRSRKESK